MMNVKTLTKERSLPQLFQPTLTVFAAAVASLFLATPSQAFELVFSSPNVVSSVKGASFTLPSTGVTSLYDVTLRQGTVGELYGTPPTFDVTNEADAVAIMDASAQGINFYAANVSSNLSFGVPGIDVFYLPYGIDQSTGSIRILASRSRYACVGSFCSVNPTLVSLDPGDPLIYAEVTAVPEPLTILGAATAVGFGASFKRRLAKVTKENKNS